MVFFPPLMVFIFMFFFVFSMKALLPHAITARVYCTAVKTEPLRKQRLNFQTQFTAMLKQQVGAMI